MKKAFSRLLCLLLVLLLPLPVFAEGNPEEPLYRSHFTFSPHVYAENCPGTLLHWKDWERFLAKLTVEGTMDVQRPLNMMDQYNRMNAALCVNGKESIPFLYESYGTSRYFTSPLIKGDTMFFGMLNFDLFMLKPYMFMGLPTNLISMALLPEQLFWAVEKFSGEIDPVLEGRKTVSYEDLYSLCETLGNMVANNKYDRYYYICTGLFGLIWGDNLVYDDLCYLTDWLDFLDPEQTGMTVAKKNGVTTYTVGETDILTISSSSGWRFAVPDPNGYDFTVAYENTDGEMDFSILAMLDGDERLNFSFRMDGLPEKDGLTADGIISVRISGGALTDAQDIDRFDFDIGYHYAVSSHLYPRSEELSADLLNPETGLPIAGFSYSAVAEIAPGEDIVNARKDDAHKHAANFFGLNGDVLAQYKQDYKKSVILSAAPIALEMPLGVMTDAVTLLEESGFLAFFGLEGGL